MYLFYKAGFRSQCWLCSHNSGDWCNHYVICCKMCRNLKVYSLCWMRSQIYQTFLIWHLRTNLSITCTLILASKGKEAELSAFVTMQERLVFSLF